jgi:hypothetical protein
VNDIARRSALLLASPLLALLAMPVQAADLRPFSASYAVTYSGASAGTSDLQLQQLPDGRWSYKSHLKTKFIVSLLVPRSKIPANEHSLFRIQNGRIVPETFSAAEDTPRDPRFQQLQFDWQRGRVTGVAAGKPVDLPLEPGLLDEMSAQLALMLELSNGRQPTRFAVLDQDRIKEYDYSAEGSALISTEAGEYRTVIYRSSRVGSDKSTLYWCAPELGHLPLKVERHEGKDVKWSIAVKSVQIDPPR